MTEFIIGSSGSGKGAAIIERIRERLGTGRKMYLIVPDQQALLWEERICRELPPQTALSLEIVSFKRLADVVFRQIGGLFETYAGGARKILMMWCAVASVRESLEVYRVDAGHEEKYVSSLLDTLGEMCRSGVSVPSLADAASRLDPDEDEVLIKKLSDLSAIFSSYRAIEETLGAKDPDNILEALAAALRDHDVFGGCDVFIDSFYSFTPVENEILYYLMRSANDIVMTFTMKEDDVGAHFDHVRRHLRTARSVASATSREVTVTHLGENLRCRSRDILYLQDNLWNFSAPPLSDPSGDVAVVRCRDRYEEARAVGGEIERLVRSGAAYSDIAVVAGDIETYRGILDVHLERLGIPYHLSKRNSISTSPVLTLISGLLEVVTYNFRREEIVKCLKTGLCPVTDRECANFEEYVATWNLRGRSAYLSGRPWEMNPAGYRRDLTERAAQVLSDANRVKGVMSEALSRIDTLFSGGEARVADICAMLYDVLVSFGVYDAVLSDAEALEEAGLYQDAASARGSFDAVVETMNVMIETIPDEMISPGAASRLFCSAASTFDVATIPRGVDMVTLNSASGFRSGEIRHIILIGCVEGEFPASPRERAFFGDRERMTLERVGIVLGDDSKSEIAEGLFRFWRCVTTPSETVTVIYPARADGAPAYPSVGTRQILRLLSLEARDFAPESELAVFSPASARALLNAGAPRRVVEASRELLSEYPELSAALRSESLSADTERVDPAVARSIAKGRLSLTQSRIDTFSECPFSYYMKYILKLAKRESASVGAVDVGNLVHRILELFFSETAGREYPIPDDEAERIVSRITEEYVAEIMRGHGASARQKYLFSRLKRNVLNLVGALMEEFSETDFRPYKFELPMEFSDDSPRPLEYSAADGVKVSLFGTIDRVDRFSEGGRVYLRVVDYKTYIKNFNEDDIKEGLNLQLLIYLFTLWKGDECAFRRTVAPLGEKILPAGMIYLSTAPDKATSEVPVDRATAAQLASKTIERSGLVLDDAASLEAMGRALGDKYIPPKRVTQRPIEYFEELYGSVREVVEQIAEDILGGDCASRPVKHGKYFPCTWCEMKPVCRHKAERRDDDE
ncbi:MAG: PD-(D/E)XK nuclease family protein [Clostridia bacterium]|nr:PD-(D/E)XK nuclease family protein [Clostridia bacterium]